MRTRRAGVVLAAGLVALLAGCLEDRPRPAPPRLSIHFDRDSISSPDTLSGTIRADDPIGIDSVWITVDTSARVGADGGFNTTFEAPFVFLVGGGFPPGRRIPVQLEGRDIGGFDDVLDTFVVVK